MDLKSLISKLSPPCRKALEAAAQLCVSQTHFNVEVEHFLLKLFESSNTDASRVLRYYDIDVADVTKELTRAMDKLKRGNNRTPTLSPQIPLMIQEAWVVSSLHLESSIVRSGGIIQALLDNEALRGIIVDSAPSLLKLPREKMREDMPELVRGSSDEKGVVDVSSPSASGAPTGDSKTPALDQYTVDLTAQARAGKIDPVQGRDFEIRQIIDILTRRRQNNPILTGDAGVGKTAVVEGFALRIAKGDVPPSLQPITVRMLDIGLLQAGAGVRGEFENRLKSVIGEVKSSPHPIILFIDEAHTLIGAGAVAGQGDAANLLKPALARGELRTIAATTWSEYKKYFEKDPALARRFQVIQVDEPDERAAMAMLRGVVLHLEKHHGVRILDEAVHDAVTLSNRYIAGRKLPDKAISVLDTACARVAIGQTSTPAEVEAAIRNIARIEDEIAILKREELIGRDHPERLKALTDELNTAGGEHKSVAQRWQDELTVFRKIRELQMKFDAISQKSPAEELDPLRRELAALKKELAALQKDQPIIPLYVDSNIIASVVSGWTGIPVGKMLTDEIRSVLRLKEKMAERVVGQLPALDAISRRIRTSRADLVDPGKPVGVFLLVGPSGVGKTETAIALAELLYGGESNMVVVNMSEYQEAHSVSGLKGSPPGYVGYGSGGVLTEAVRRDPYTVLLLDEVEKAHPDVMDLFYQVFDKGQLEDGEGLSVNFKNTVIILTSNVGTDVIMKECRDRAKLPDAETLVEMLRPELLRYFRPAFLGRLVVVPYYPLGDDEIQKIVMLKLEKIQRRFKENHRAELTYDAAIVEAIADRCTEVDSGARNIDHILTHTLLPEVSTEVLDRMGNGQSFRGVHVALDASGSFVYSFL